MDSQVNLRYRVCSCFVDARVTAALAKAEGGSR